MIKVCGPYKKGYYHFYDAKSRPNHDCWFREEMMTDLQWTILYERFNFLRYRIIPNYSAITYYTYYKFPKYKTYFILKWAQIVLDRWLISQGYKLCNSYKEFEKFKLLI